MKVRDLISQEIDIDVYDNVCEEIGICFCGPLKLTPAGEAEFREVMDYEIKLDDDYGDICAVVDVDGEEGVWQKKLKKAKKFFNSAAGYCADTDYKNWFKE